MKLVTFIYWDAALLPHFLKHYSQLGVTSFHCSVNLMHNDQLLEEVTHLAKNYHLSIDFTYQEEDTDPLLQKQRINTLLKRHATPGEWLIIVDLDEFLVIKESLNEIIQECDESGYDVIEGELLDRTTLDGSVPAIKPSSLFEQFPHVSHFSKKYCGCHIKKIIMVKGYKKLSTGHHLCEESYRSYPRLLDIHHFKWHAGVIEKLQKRAIILKQLNVPWKNECQTILDYYKENGKIPHLIYA